MITIHKEPEDVQDHYEVVIAGGGYAGLAAALPLGGRALVIDQHEIGAIQRSACAAPVEMLARFNLLSSAVQIYPKLILHTPYGKASFRLAKPYCIFDHERLCRLLFEQSGAHFLRARVRSVRGNVVDTSAGSVRGDVLIDATGWPGALATALKPELSQPERMTIGIEADLPGRGSGIHFFIDKCIVLHGYAWVFPAGDELRVGVAAYDDRTDPKAALREFLTCFDLEARPSRGGNIPWFKRPPVVEHIFVVGDAAGQTFPLTAEGIRFALHFGQLAGNIARHVIDGELRLEEGLRHYGDATLNHQRRIAYLNRAQTISNLLPDRLIHHLSRGLSLPGVDHNLQRRYLHTPAGASMQA